MFDFNSMGGHVSFITSSIFKVIMSSTWVCSFIFNIPLFLFSGVDEESGNSYVTFWPQLWMSKAYSLLILVLMSLLLMIWFAALSK